MAIPASWSGRLALPVVAAPMFLTSGPDLVMEACRAGIVGTFPALNQRTTEGYRSWLTEIDERLSAVSHGRPTAPFGVNLIVHKTNPRLSADLAVTVEKRVPLVITLGAVPDVVQAVHAYGGLVFHDVINSRHARKAAAAGVDGLILVSAGAGGHAGTWNPFALVSEIAAFFTGTIVLAGAISTGRHVAAARMMGADLAYVGTRFIATKESLVPDAYKQMIVNSSAADIIYTPKISGIHANFLRPSLVANGLDPENLQDHGALDMESEIKVWKTVWSAGQGVGSIHDIPTVSQLVSRFTAEFAEAVASVVSNT
jgi:nitronate monooxygenase